jgi:hypothetical protein
MKEIVAYCGIVCTECPAYKATRENDNKARAKVAEEWSIQFKHPFKPEEINCDGCLAVGKRLVNYCSACEIRKCGSGQHVLNCGYCLQYPCDKLNDFHTRARGTKYELARAKLGAIRNKR